MLGMAARSSMAAPTGALRNSGAISVINIAIPNAIGIAIMIDNNVVTIVPKRLVAAPKDSITGFQSVELRNFKKPNLFIESEDSENKTQSIPVMRMTTEKDAIPVIIEKNISMGFLLNNLCNLINPFILPITSDFFF
jgi:hypothetical protein